MTRNAHPSIRTGRPIRTHLALAVSAALAAGFALVAVPLAANAAPPALRIEKVASQQHLPSIGEDIGYTVTATNIGATDAIVVVVDDVSGVFDDAALLVDSLSATVHGDLGLEGERIVWTGVLRADQSVVISYEFDYQGTGDDVLENVAFGTDDSSTVTPSCNPRNVDGLDPTTGLPCDRSVVPANALVAVSSVRPPSGSEVQAGDVLDYLIAFTNGGATDASIDSTDYLGGLLDDADVTTPPTSDDLAVGPLVGNRFTITGLIPAGEVFTVTFRATVRQVAELGDHRIATYLVSGDATPPSTCIPGEETCTINLVPQPEALAATGEAAGGAAIAAVLLLVFGGFVVIVRRRMVGRAN